MTWHQSYSIFGQSLGISAAIAAIPIAILLYLLAIKRKPAWLAALAGFGATLVLALAAYKMPASHALSSAAYGAAFGLFPICWIVYWAIVLYRVVLETGKFETIKNSVSALTTDSRLQALIIAFAFGAFIEGAAGFGTPVAVAAAMMVGLGCSAYYASAMCLLANTAPVAFGSIGIPVITLAGITGLPLAKLSAAVGRLCAPVSLILPAYLLIAMGEGRSLAVIWPAALVAGVAFATVQILVSTFVGPQLTDILSSLTAIGALVIFFRVWHPRREKNVRGEETSRASSFRADPVVPARRAAPESALVAEAPPQAKLIPREVFMAWLPYILLVVFVVLWGLKPVQNLLNTVTVIIHWPLLHNLVQRMPPVVPAPSPYAAVYTFNWLSASGTSCLFATLLAAALLRMPLGAFIKLLFSTARQLALPILTIATVLSMAFVMNYCGATGTLGLAFAATGHLFPFFSAFLGWLGVFLTGSDTSSNALFGSLQVVTAHRLGISPNLIAAVNSAGGVMGKMISIQSIAVAAAATGLTIHEQAKLLRFTLRHSIVLASLIGLEALLYTYVFHVM